MAVMLPYVVWTAIAGAAGPLVFMLPVTRDTKVFVAALCLSMPVIVWPALLVTTLGSIFAPLITLAAFKILWFVFHPIAVRYLSKEPARRSEGRLYGP